MNIPSGVRDALLDAALTEACGAAEPPDVWRAIEAAVAFDAPTTPRRNAWIPAVAAVLFGVLVLAGVYVFRQPKPMSVATPIVSTWLDPSVDPQGPSSLEELRELLRGEGSVGKAEIEVWTVTSQLLGRPVAVRPHELYLLFGGYPQLTLRSEQRDVLRTALLGVEAAPLQLDGRPWEAVVALDVAGRRVRLAIAGCGGWPEREPLADWQFAVCGPEGALGVSMSPDLWRDLYEPMAQLVSRTLRDSHVVIGDTELARMDDDASRLTLHGVSKAVVEKLQRFAKLRFLDVRGAPALHQANALRQLVDFELTSLQVDGALLQADGVAAIGAIGTLEELFFRPDGVWQILPPPAPRAPALDDAGVQALLALEGLQELCLAGAALTNDGLRALGRLPKLGSLSLFDCGALDGAGLDGLGSGLDKLTLVRVPLSPEGLRAVGALAGLRRLTVVAPEEPQGLDGLEGSSATRINWWGPLGAAGLESIARLRDLSKLSLMANPTLTADLLLLLRTSASLENVEILDCPGIERSAFDRVVSQFEGVNFSLEGPR